MDRINGIRGIPEIAHTLDQTRAILTVPENYVPPTPASQVSGISTPTWFRQSPTPPPRPSVSPARPSPIPMSPVPSPPPAAPSIPPVSPPRDIRIPPPEASAGDTPLSSPCGGVATGRCAPTPAAYVHAPHHQHPSPRPVLPFIFSRAIPITSAHGASQRRQTFRTLLYIVRTVSVRRAYAITPSRPTRLRGALRACPPQGHASGSACAGHPSTPQGGSGSDSAGRPGPLAERPAQPPSREEGYITPLPLALRRVA
jgi:hypothetical protein